jgi:pyrroloquinoline quinone biosynthesis protein E
MLAVLGHKAGLDHIQLSFQDAEEDAANQIAGARAHAHKIALARPIKRHPVAFTMNLVVHRQNLERLEAMIALAEELETDRLEIAHVQYHGWALHNRDSLLPARDQWERSLAIITAARERLKGRMRVDFVAPDYYATYPKACMGGWGRGVILIDPAGRALPCHAAGSIPGLEFDNVGARTLRWIWEESAAFQKFRGEDWMPEPCRSCDRRAQDFGGCRCQALALTGDATATDPVCTLSPAHSVVEAVIERVNAIPVPQARWVYRINPPSA